jgi:hypothetical protein
MFQGKLAVQKMRLYNDLVSFEKFPIFMGSILNFLDLNLFIKMLENCFHELQLFYLDLDPKYLLVFS